jgi:predicted transcriptional regulator
VPFSQKIVKTLVDQYKNLLTQEHNMKTGGDKSKFVMSRSACTRAIRRLLEAVKKQTELLSMIRATIYPVLLHIL